MHFSQAAPHRGKDFLRQTLRIMRLTTLLLFTGLVQIHAAVHSQNARFNIRESHVALKKIFREIEASSDYSFFYRLDQIDLKEKVDVSIRDGRIDAVMKQVLQGQPLTYDIIGNIVVIKPLNGKTTGPVIPIRGTVRDSSTHQPLIGVSVQLRGTKAGTVTNEKGEFTIAASDSAVLVFSFIGYVTQEVAVNGHTSLPIMLRPGNTGMNEVVVVGYGTQKKSNVTGAIAQIGSKMLEDRPITNVGQALQGVVPGLNINFADGHPGSEAKINVRGYTSINGGTPLVVIDGVPGDINLINPSDIETISVLKDAGSAALYGSRAAYGVVLVTTKHGKKGKLQVNYSGNYSVNTPTTPHTFMTDGYLTDSLVDQAFRITTGSSYTGYTAADYAQMKLRETDHSLPSVVVQNRAGRDQYVYYANTDWWKYLFLNTLPSMSHAITLSGGSDNVDFLVSGRYYQEKGMMRFNTDQYTNYNLRAKVDARLKPWLKLSENLQFTTNTYNFPGWGVNTTFVEMGVHALPSYSPINPDGTFTYRTNLNNYGIGDGIAADLQYGKSKGQQQNFDFTNTTALTVDITRDISLVGSYSYDLNPYSSFQRKVVAPWSIYPGEVDYVGSDTYTEAMNNDQYHVVNAYGNYQHSFGKHNLKVTAGYNQELKKYKQVNGTANNLLSQDLNDFDLGTSGQVVGGNEVEWALLGYFARINYDYNNRYLLELDGRYDGSSHFPADSRYGFFPSVSGGWRISEENFFKMAKKTVSELKLRGSYGSLGNQSLSTDLRSSDYPYIPTMGSGTNVPTNWLIGGNKAQYLSSPAPVTPQLTWETIRSADIGLDLGLLRNRLNATFDWYDRKTLNMLIAGKTLPAIFGAGSPKQNAADLDTKGFELGVNWQDNTRLGGKTFTYNFGIVLSDFKSHITRFDNPSLLLSNHYAGERIGSIWGYTTDGYFKTDDEAAHYAVDQDYVNGERVQSPGNGHNLQAGDLKFVDLDGNDTINKGQNTLLNHGDMKILGNSLPRYSFGVNMGASWNGFDISLFVQGIGHQDWYPGSEAYMFWGFYGRPYYSFIPKDFASKIWSPTNQNAYFPLLRGYDALNAGSTLTSVNNRYMQNLAYARLKNLTIGYNLPASVMKRWKTDRIRIYFSGENLLTWTALKTKYIDPEQVSADPNGLQGDNNARNYPFMKNYSFGVDVTF
jgi:TonB-linked SusC/RagA family outer membrane protein